MGGRKAKIAEFHVSYYTVFYLNEKKSRLDVVVLRSILIIWVSLYSIPTSGTYPSDALMSVYQSQTAS
jgi:hypothetical protein